MPNEEHEDGIELEIDEVEEETVTLKKSDFKKLDRKARAFDANKNEKPQVASQPSQDNSDFSTKLARLELKTEGYDDDAIDFAMQYGGKEALKNPFVQAAVKSIQEQKRAENAVVSDDNSKSDIERKFTDAELNAMSPEELYKILPKAQM